MMRFVRRPNAEDYPVGERYVEAKEVPPGQRRQRVAIHGDFQEPVQSMIDGNRYGDKRSYNQHVKDHGCQVVGNDLPAEPPKQRPKDDPSLKGDIHRAYAELTA